MHTTRMSNYLEEYLKFDIISGVTVALIAIPQAMAYAIIAGVNPIYGLYTAIIPAIIGSLFASSKYIITGPTNATAMVTASVLFLYSEQANYVEIVFVLAVLAGIIKIIIGLLGLGNFIKYVSNSVITGFLCGAGFLIILNQFGNILGIERIPGVGSLSVLLNIFNNLADTNIYILSVGIIAMSILLVGKLINRKFPSALISVLITSILVQLTGWQNKGVVLIGDIDFIPSINLAFHLPAINLSEVSFYISSALALAIFSMVEAGSISKAIGLTTEQKVNPSREVIAQGVASMIGGFFRCIPSSASPSRSAVNLSSGGKTRLSGVYSGMFIFIFLLTISGMIRYIPLSSLSAIIIISAISLINPENIKLIWNSRIVSRILLLATFLSTILLPVQYAIYIGVVLSVIIYLVETSHIDITYLTQNDEGDFLEFKLEELFNKNPKIAIVNIGGSLYFGAVSDLESKLEKILDGDTKIVILRLRRMKQLASTGISSIESFVSKANEQGVSIILCGVNEEIQSAIEKSGLQSIIGSEKTLKATPIIFESTCDALSMAKEIYNSNKVAEN